MGEEIEVRDVNGYLVKVPLHPALAAIGDALMLGETRVAVRSDGLEVEVRLIDPLGIGQASVREDSNG